MFFLMSNFFQYKGATTSTKDFFGKKSNVVNFKIKPYNMWLIYILHYDYVY